jgi:hypothetical protein
MTSIAVSQDDNRPVEHVIKLNLKKYQHDMISAISVLNMETVEAYIQRAVIGSLHADLDGGEEIKCHASYWKKRLDDDMDTAADRGAAIWSRMRILFSKGYYLPTW